MGSSWSTNTSLPSDLPPASKVSDVPIEQLVLFSTLVDRLYCKKLADVIIRENLKPESKLKELKIDVLDGLYSACALHVLDRPTYDCFFQSRNNNSTPGLNRSFDDIYVEKFNYISQLIENPRPGASEQIAQTLSEYKKCFMKNEGAFRVYMQRKPTTNEEMDASLSEYQSVIERSNPILSVGDKDTVELIQLKAKSALKECNISEDLVKEVYRLENANFIPEQDPARLNRVYQMVRVNRCVQSRLCANSIQQCIMTYKSGSLYYCLDQITTPCTQKVFNVLKQTYGPKS